MRGSEIKKDFESVLAYWSKLIGGATERNRLLILVALLDSELQSKHRSLTFSELLKITGLKKSDLNYHLEILHRLELIEGRNREPYHLSEEGHKILQVVGVTKELLLKFRQQMTY
jgi:RIO-like serine/threonine protein kinase